MHVAYNDLYRKQLALLVKALPHAAKEECFALKGGTAINLFIRNLPRLSVDIDLTYLPVAERSHSLSEIDMALKRIGQSIQSSDSTTQITESAPGTQKEITKLIIRTNERVQIKIEVTPVLRGCIYDPVLMSVCEQVENDFGFAEIKVLSFADLYAGKIMAALDRQHPRDLFDIHLLFENEGISDDLRTAMIVYLISHDHSPHSLLKPVLRDITKDFEHNFAGMTGGEVTLDCLIATRDRLIKEVTNNMPENHKTFLHSFYGRKPDWALLGLDNVHNLPAVKWREFNLAKAGEGTCEELLLKLEKAFHS